jgi:thiol-disulfide isomerase/thioredoxin
MKIKLHIILLIQFSIFLAMNLNAQKIPVYDFAQFEPLLHQKNDTTYVINFWATWCKPCVEELPHFLEINSQYSDKKFKMILVSLDYASQLNSKLLPFVNSHRIDADVILLNAPDANSWIDKVNKTWTGSIPATIIFNKDFYFFLENSMSYDELNEIIKQHVK